MDASWERAKSLWETAKRIWHKCLIVLGILFIIGFVVFVPWMIWDMIHDSASRHVLAQKELRNLKWWVLWVVLSWLIAKIWRKPKETEDVGEQPSVQGSEPKGRRKNHRRVQRRR